MTQWSAPQCPFVIEYDSRVLDDIRLIVVDAFFSLPRGGAEIGGILLGRCEKGRIAVTDFQALECEHAYGPSFQLSPNDLAKLADLLASARGNPGGTQPVGWYHSHTRSEIFLSPADLEIHKRFFPEPWQIALVMKPHTFQPTRVGFFFREADGAIHSEASYQEIVLHPLPMRPAAEAPAEPKALAPAGRVAPEPVPVPFPAPLAVPEPAPADEAPPLRPPAREIPPPTFALSESARPRRRLKVPLAILTGLALLALLFVVRDAWVPQIAGLVRHVTPASAPPYIGLNTIDANGQLQIRWDRNSPAVRTAIDAILVIVDGPAPEAVELDATHLQAGVFTYGRKGERVDVTMTLNTPDRQKLREATSYLGRLPDKKAPLVIVDPAAARERDALAKKAEQMDKDLRANWVRTRKLEKSLQDLQKEQQRKRLENQIPDQKQ